LSRYNRQNALMQQYPTGVPAGPGYMPVPGMAQQFQPSPGVHQMPILPATQQLPIMPTQQMPVIPVTQQYQAVPGPSTQTTENILYTAGYMRTQIGRRVKVEFLIGTNMLVDREGTLEAVGASYIIIQEAETDDLLLCDLYSIKFVKFYY
jgi:hypothetical protein